MSDLEIFSTLLNYGSTSNLTTSNSNQSPTRPSYFDRHVWRAQQGYDQSHGNTIGGSSYAAPAMLSARDARSPETSQLEDGEARDENPRFKNAVSTNLPPVWSSYGINVTDGWSDETNNQSESEDHPRLGTIVPPETVARPVHAHTHPNHSTSKVVLSLRGGGDRGVSESPTKKLRPEGSERHRLVSYKLGQHLATSAAKPGDTSTDDEPITTSPPKRTPSPNTFFSNAFSTFQALPNYIQRYTQGYLNGEAVADWAAAFDMPLMDMLERLRYCVLLLCEAENPALRHIMRSPGRYALFRDGMSANCVAQDDDEFVLAVRRGNLNLYTRLRRPHERMRILWALRTVDFPRLMAEAED